MTDYVQTQDNLPPYNIILDQVGVTSLKTFIRIKRNGSTYRFIVLVDIFVDLQADVKGVHMSRLVESTTEIFTDETHSEQTSFETLAENVLNELHSRFKSNTSSLRMKFDFASEETTPKSNRRTVEVYPVELYSKRHIDGKIIHQITVTSLGNTVCPHALAVAEGKRTHVQRAKAYLSIIGYKDDLPLFEEIIKILEGSFSSPTFATLKTQDEEWIVQRMFENPLFVEDVCRVLLGKANEQFKTNVNIKGKVVSEESIHKHDVTAKGHIERNPNLRIKNSFEKA